ncbi:TrmH family RNA methyltransferase [Aeoliella mucimassa]|uniref:23S rRNA (Uridine(2479)-2'-O)-methyltransferase n=1 Tax=Aeoliella mucimassa TaxID=2527972 RepID=A0A518AUU6_9BACT|nr:RNA methyltransferase [Aeoliella mucimassa]QDU58497.1 23S rRNA (uridine(2479)-2'-O)-methyltransferase [Aeoliella mucimassa]
MITSRQNPRIKAACALRNRSTREQESKALVYGVRESARALAVGAKPLECLWCSKYFRSDEASAVVDELRQAGADVVELSDDAFDKLAYGDRLDGVVSVFATKPRGVADLELPDRPLVAVLEGIEKPGNLGAILRSADGAGVDAVVVADPVIDLYNPNAIRASVAAVFQPNVVTATSAEVIAWLRDRSLAIWAARPDAEGPYWAADYCQGGAIVLGSESQGLTDAWLGSGMQPVMLPMLGVADSLNVSVTAAILFYEARRQRSIAP